MLKGYRTYLWLITACFFIGPWIFQACDKDRFNHSAEARLKFSTDTLLFDTIFTSIGSTTYELRVGNPYREDLYIDEIFLAGGETSPYRLNIDGETAGRVEDIVLQGRDSIFIFAEVTIDPTQEDQPFVVKDSIVFRLNGNIQDVDLVSFGQNVHLLSDEVISGGVWDSLRPYLMYSSCILDTGEILRIAEGTEVYFHRGTTFYIAGSLIVEGSKDHPAVFKGDRPEAVYDDVPGQWNGFYFVNGSSGNSIRNARIENAVSGIHMGNLFSEDPPPDLVIENTVIQHMNITGLSSINARIDAGNLIVAHCGLHCVALYGGGNYTFTHCTFANQWEYSSRTTPGLIISDYFEYGENTFAGTLEEAVFYNTIVSGNRDTEVGIALLTNYAASPYQFVSCMVDLDTTGSELRLPAETHSVYLNQAPAFLSWYDYDFRIDSLSFARGKADPAFASGLPYDVFGRHRLLDEGPDIGAVEWTPGDKTAKR